MNTINKLTFKDIVKILRNHQNDKLMSVFLISIIITLLYSLIPVSANFFYRVGNFVADLLLGYVVGYIIYFLTFIVPYDSKVFDTNRLLKKRFKKLKEKLDELIIDITGDCNWINTDRSKLIQLVKVRNIDRDINSEIVIAYKDENGSLRVRRSKLECYYSLIVEIEDIIRSTERYSEYVVNKQLMNLLYFLLESDFHKWIKAKYPMPKLLSEEFKKLIEYNLFDQWNNNVEEDYLYTVKQLFSEMDKQLNYG